MPVLFEPKVPKIEIRKIKPPNHWELERQSKSGSFKFSRFEMTEKPVVVKPDIASK